MSHYFKLVSTYCLVDDNYNYSYCTFSYSTFSAPQVMDLEFMHTRFFMLCLSMHLVNKIMPIDHIVESFLFIFLHNIKRNLHLTNVGFLQGFPTLEDQEE